MPRKSQKNKEIDQNNDATMLQSVPKKRRGGDNAKTSETRVKFLFAYEQSFGNISYACGYANINRSTFYRWMQSNSRVNRSFQKKIELIKPIERQLDFAEGMLMNRIAAGDTTAIIFALKTRGKSRGYGEKTFDLEYELVLRAVNRIENIITQQIKRDPNWKPDIKRFSELAALDFGVKPEDVEKEFLKRQPQELGGLQ